MTNDERMARVANILGCDADYGMIEPTLLELKQERDELLEIRDELRAELNGRKPSCGWCGYEPDKAEDILNHLLQCEKRPDYEFAHGLVIAVADIQRVECLFARANEAKRNLRRELSRIKDHVRDYWKIDNYPIGHFVADVLGEKEAVEIGALTFDVEQDPSEYR